MEPARPWAVVALAAAARPARTRRDGFVLAGYGAGLATMLLVPGAVAVQPTLPTHLRTAAALAGGHLLSCVAERKGRGGIAVAAVVIVATVAASLWSGYSLFRPVLQPTERCAAWIREHTPADALVLTNREEPTVLYLANRRGWICWFQGDGTPIDFSAELVDWTHRNGARVIAVTGSQEAMNPQSVDPFSGMNSGMRDMLFRRFAVYHGSGFAVFDLTKPADTSTLEGEVLDFSVPANRRFLRGNWDVSYSSEGDRTVVKTVPGEPAALGLHRRGTDRQIELTVASPVAGTRVQVGHGDGLIDVGTVVEAGRPYTFTFAIPQGQGGRLYRVSIRGCRPPRRSGFRRVAYGAACRVVRIGSISQSFERG